MVQDTKAVMEELYRLYEQKMFAVAYCILHQNEQAEDAVHDAFVKLVNYLPRIKKPDSDKTRKLVMQVIKTTAIDQYRRNHRDLERRVEEEQAVNEKQMMVFPMQKVEDQALITDLLEQLPKDYLEVIKLRCYYGFSNEETAEILHLSKATTAKRLERARKMVKHYIESEGTVNENKCTRLG